MQGIDAATGEAIIFTDADSLFLPNTISQIVRWFGSADIDAVCGNDAPLNPSTPIQKFLSITTHIGTGFVRRALSITGCLPIITGNLGAVRASVLKEIKGFKEIWGEDLEITFRLHKARKRLSLTQSQGNGRVPCNIKGIVETAHQMDAKLHKDNFSSQRYIFAEVQAVLILSADKFY